MTEDKVVTEFRALSFSSPSVFLTVYYEVRVLHFQRSPYSALGVLDDHALYKSTHAVNTDIESERFNNSGTIWYKKITSATFITSA